MKKFIFIALLALTLIGILFFSVLPNPKNMQNSTKITQLQELQNFTKS